MSCRSQSDAYKSALTDRFTPLNEKMKSTLTKDGLACSEISKPFDIHRAQIFEHQPLRDPSTELRYLYLLPKTQNINLDGQTLVRCELLSDAEEQAPRYIGLSYTWGDPRIRRPILVGDKIFHATENLTIALEHLQEEEKTIIFWIDALCIDQNNSNEKSIQVRRMGNIFASAALVIAWLGSAADESDLVLQELENYHKDAANWLYQLDESHGERFAALPIAQSKALFARSWFQRVWVGQEVALNERVIFVCGQRDLYREQLLECYMTLMRSMSIWRGERARLDFLRFEHTEALPLAEFLNHEFASIHLACGNWLESSDPRDFVYSSFGRISDTEECGLRVDYTMATEELYTEFTEAFIRAGEILPLSACWRRSSTYENLPSWVPDWSNTEIRRTLRYVLEGDTAEICVTQRGSKALKISARRVAEVSRVDYSLPSQQGIADVSLSMSALCTQQEFQRIKLFHNTAQQVLSCKERWSAEEVDEAILDLSTGMSFTRFAYDDNDAKVADVLSKSFQAFQRLSTPLEDNSDPQTWRKDPKRAYIHCVQDANIKNLFRTSTDIVGTSQDDVQPGDWLYILGGCEGAWVLRKAEECCYRIVSLAYVFPWKDVKECDAPVETITIV